MDLTGTVRSVSPDRQTAEVQAGRLTIRVSMQALEKMPDGTVAWPAPSGGTVRPAARVTSPSLDLRGKRADEVEVLLDGYLNDVTLANFSEVQVVHGIGTGTVRQIVRDFLAGHPLVKSFRTGRDDEGRDGVTIVSL
jgi:DNA mismatch repair protein MutS2